MMVLPDVNFGENKNKDVIYFFPCMASFFNHLFVVGLVNHKFYEYFVFVTSSFRNAFWLCIEQRKFIRLKTL